MARTPPPNGTVFLYPFLWNHQAKRGIEHAKDRTCCLALTLPVSGKQAIVPISDQESADALGVSTAEKRRAGLDAARPAYVHVNEANIDKFASSWHFNPQAKPLGRFSDGFSREIYAAILEALRQRKLRATDRTR
jgi:hypothetical protein